MRILHLPGKTTALQRQMVKKCYGIASATATVIEQDIAGYKEFIKTRDTRSPYYRQIKSIMEKIRTDNEGSIIYLDTEIRLSDDRMMYILDGEKEGSSTFSPPGSTDSLTESRRMAYETKAPYMGYFVTNKWGTLLSAYAPITNLETGEFIGLVGSDVSLDQYNEITDYQLLIILGSIGMRLLLRATILVASSGRIEKTIMRDGLTGAYKKSYFLHALKRQIGEAGRTKIPVTVMMADLDNFKNINDTYGHPFGDIVLEAVAKALSTGLRQSDCLARYGGEEFVAFFPGLSGEMADSVLNRLRKQVENLRLYNEEYGRLVPITISIGGAQIAPGQTPADVIDLADRALYDAKRTKNTVSLSSTGSRKPKIIEEENV
ncbi:MAG: diguanylate cyclase [Oxalobacter sp.]|nr:diguanylate cyclase [Oxalobacter sp.]